MAAENFKVKRGLEVGTGSTITSGGVNITGIITAVQFKGDGSGLTGVVGSGSGVVIKDEGSTVGTAGTINFVGSDVSAAISEGTATVTVSGISTANIVTDTLNVSGISTFNNEIVISSANPTIVFDQISGTLPDNQYRIRGGGGKLTLQVSSNNGTSYSDAVSIGGIGNIFIPDNDKVYFGTNNDAYIQHDNSNLNVINTTGNIDVTGNVVLNNDLDVDGHTELDNVNITGFTTFSTGTKFFHHTPQIEMQGNSTATLSFVNATTGTTAGTDGMLMGFSSSSKAGFINVNESGHGFVLKVGGSHTSAERINISGVGTVSIRKGTTEEMITARPDGAVELYFDANRKFETTNSGVDITGICTATSFSGLLVGNVQGNATSASSCSGNSVTATTATTATNVTVADESTDTTCFLLFTTDATGNLPPKSGTNLTFNSSTGQLNATKFVGDGSGLTDLPGGGSYGNNDVDTHLNISTASNGEVLSWNGSDYDWVAQSGGSGISTANVVTDTLNVSGVSTFTGNVRIGDNASYSANTNGDNLAVGSTSGSHGISIISGNTSINNSGSLFFGDSGSSIAGAIRYYHSTNYMLFRIAGSERLRITSTGHVGIGTGVPTNAVTSENTKKLSVGIVSAYQFYGDGLIITGVSTFNDHINVTGRVTCSAITINDGQPGLVFEDTNADPDFILQNRNGSFAIRDITSSPGVNRFFVNASNGDVTVTGNIVGDNSTNISGISSVTATSFHGSGALLTTLNADNLGSGEIPNGRFPATLPAVSGENLTNLPAANLTGTVNIARIADSAVTFAKMQDVSTGVLIGRNDSGGGVMETLTAAEVRTLIDKEHTWTLGATGDSNHYTFTGPGGLSSAEDPTIYLARGQTYEFVNNSGGSHPFQIRVSNGGSAYSTGVSNNGASSGTIKFEVPFSAPNTLYYQCTSHSNMGGNIVVYPSI